MTAPTLPLGHTDQIGDTYWLALPYLDLTNLPSPNKRQHWALRNQQTKTLRETTHWLARKAHIPTCEHVHVELHYLPPDRRRRDSDNLVLILKAAADGLVDAGLVPDDTPQWMTKHMPLIHPKTDVDHGHSRLLLRVTPRMTRTLRE